MDEETKSQYSPLVGEILSYAHHAKFLGTALRHNWEESHLAEKRVFDAPVLFKGVTYKPIEGQYFGDVYAVLTHNQSTNSPLAMMRAKASQRDASVFTYLSETNTPLRLVGQLQQNTSRTLPIVDAILVYDGALHRVFYTTDNLSMEHRDLKRIVEDSKQLVATGSHLMK